jgi:hypothetical protein
MAAPQVAGILAVALGNYGQVSPVCTIKTQYGISTNRFTIRLPSVPPSSRMLLQSSPALLPTQRRSSIALLDYYFSDTVFEPSNLKAQPW